ncbi:MAG: response regulator [Desulfobacterales bacterium]|nr:response regulator [Desulfobacterales bacterium]
MKLSTKIAFSFIIIVVLTTAVLLSIIGFEKQNLRKALSAELKQQMRHRTSEILQPIYKLCKIKEAQTIPLLRKDIKNATYLLERMGGISLGEDIVPWEIINRDKNREIELPMMLIGEEWLGLNKDPDLPSPIVDDIWELSGAHCSIFLRVNQQGDMLNVCTSTRTINNQRAVGTYISHVKPDGAPVKMIAHVIEGRQYLERASYANGWMTLICEPLTDTVTEEIIGSLCVSLHQKGTVNAIRKIILETQIGKSGYIWVLGSRGERRGAYVISKDGMRDGEKLWRFQDENGQYFIQAIVRRALQTKGGDVRFYRYPWKNPEDTHPRMKISAFTYFEPWDWIIGSSAYEDDFQDPQIRVSATLGNMFYLTLFAGLALILCSVLVGYLMHRTIRSFTEERELQNWLKTSLNELGEKIRGEQKVGPLANNILNHLAAAMQAQIGVIYQKQASDLLCSVATHGISNPENTLLPVKFGEGLVGQAALDKQTLLLKKIPESNIMISTGFGEVIPRDIIIKPLVHENEVMGVIQLGSLMAFQDIHSSFMDRAAKAIAIAIYTAQSRAKVNDLLEKTQEQARDLEMISNYKSDFLAKMSHEIRTPMNAIIGLSNLILQTQMSPKQLDYQQKINSSANSLLRLIDDILDFSKIEAGKINMEHKRFYLDDVLEYMDSIVSAKTAEKGLTFSLDVSESVPPCLVGDALRLGQVLINLASNSVKFTHKGRISVVVESPGESEHEVTLQFVVSDSGIGMTREQVDNLFQPFYQADSSISRKYGGTGLGLAISKRLVELMGGDIRVSSKPGVGTEFSFTARFGKSKQKIASSNIKGLSKEEAKDLLTGKRVLLVEDNEINLQVSRELLELVGVRVTVARNGKEAVELAAAKRFDCILMDFHMPIMDGLTATREIRKGPAPPDVPILAMTANAMADDRERCIKAGMNDHISKPVKPEKLYETLIRWIIPDAAPNISQETITPSKPTLPEPVGSFQPPGQTDVRVEKEPGKESDSAESKSEFLASMSHEIHNLMNGIIGMIELMMTTELTAQQKDYSEAIAGAADSLTTVLDNGLDFLKIKARKLTVSDAPVMPIPSMHAEVLVAEDNRMNQRVTVGILRRYGCSVDIAENGMKAVERFKEKSYDIIFMDVNMPVTDGFETTEIIRQHEAGKSHVPIIAMTGLVMKKDRDKCIDAGMDDYIPKPVRSETVLDMLLKFCFSGREHSEQTEAQAKSPGKNSPVLDPGQLLNISNKDEEIIHEVIDEFMKDAPIYLKDLEKAVESGDHSQIYEKTHRLKGLVSNAGGEKLWAMILEIENDAQEGIFDDTNLSLLETELENLKQAIKETDWKSLCVHNKTKI